MINAFLDYCIQSLFITNVWIILYIKALDYLNFLFPAHLTETFFRSGLGNPERFEILLYLGLTFILVFVLFILQKLTGVEKERDPASAQRFFQPVAGREHLWEKLSRQNLSIYKIISLIFLTLLFINKLGPFPLGGDTSIHPIQISIPDLSFFYGPVFEVASGKTIFTDIPSQYGFLSILFFSVIYKFTNLNFVYLPIIIWLMYIAEYLLCFYLIRKVSGSTLFSLLGFFSIIIINNLASTYGPQAGPLRWLPIFIILFLFYKFKRLDNKILLLLISILSLWNIDSGIALIIGYLFTLFILFISGKINFKKFLPTLIFLALFSILIVGIIQVIHLLLGFKPVDFFKLYHSVRKYALIGTGMVPIEPITYFWLVMLIYFASIIYFFRKTTNSNLNQQETRNKQNSNYNNSNSKKFKILEFGSWNLFGKLVSWDLELDKILLLFSANLMFFASIYYVGRSMPHELYTLSIFAVLTLFLLIGSSYQNVSAKLRILVLFLMFLFFIAFPFSQRIEYITKKTLAKFQILSNGRIFASDIDEIVKEKYYKEVDLINDSIKYNEIIIISADDTYLFYLLKKKNLLDANPAWGNIQIQSEVAPAVKRAIKICPQKIVADCRLLNKCPGYKTLTQGDQNAFPFILQQLEKNCNVKYQPTVCTDKLCIAQTMRQ